jgi:hypothetical protein
MRPLTARGARVSLFCLLLPVYVPLVLASELGVCSERARRFAFAYATLAFRIVAHFHLAPSAALVPLRKKKFR